MDDRNLNRLELNKILQRCAEFACLDGAKKAITSLTPSADLDEVRLRLATVAECDKLLFRYGAEKVEAFSDVSELIVRALKGATLSCAELLEVNRLLRSARIAYTSVNSVSDEEIILVRGIVSRIYFDARLESDISEKIISVDAVSDYASDALYSIRSKIKSLNERIRATLSEYIGGKDAQYLRDSTVTIRNDRYVIPVKAEHKSRVKGFVHDRSQTGATFFIEPEYVLELNNELIALTIDEREEVERILKALSSRVGAMCEKLQADVLALEELDSYYARAEYAYSTKATLPKMNKRGYVNIIKGRHPLINAQTVVPVSLELGKEYNFLLLSGANAGGKTVTLKMAGLFCLMAACGLFVPAAEGTSLCVFNKIFCDVGDSQSIEDSLSTFSSHVNNVADICERADADSLVLIDELGGGTNPDEGQALAKAVLEYLLSVGCRGIITTHFTPLKEYAYTKEGVENASMEFDGATLRPLYRIKIGLPGASNAFAIARRLGLKESIIASAMDYLSEGSRSYENIVAKAEESRVEAQRKLDEAAASEREWREKLSDLKTKSDKLDRERERINAGARAESRRIINERTSRAEEILAEIEELFSREELNSADLIKARTLKNKLKNVAYSEENEDVTVDEYVPATPENMCNGANIFINSMQTKGKVLSFNNQKKEAEVLCGDIRIRCKYADLQFINAAKPQPKKNNVRVVRDFAPSAPKLEINLLGMTVGEALYEVDNFIDKAACDNLEEIRIIHGVGTGKLQKAITEHLKGHRHVKSYRFGKYGEGETGVTVVTLK